MDLIANRDTRNVPTSCFSVYRVRNGEYELLKSGLEVMKTVLSVGVLRVKKDRLGQPWKKLK
jgi:hypothetical protein